MAKKQQFRGRAFSTWSNMMVRCEDDECNDYPNYGGRGIYVCDDWREPKNFVKWYKEQNPQEGYSIDRIDNDGPYSPENCRFASQSEQLRNRRNTKWVEYQGTKLVIPDLALITGIPERTLYWRLKHDRDLMSGGDPAKHLKDGALESDLIQSEAARILGIGHETFKMRMSNYPENPELWFKPEKLNKYKDTPTGPIKNTESSTYFQFVDSPWGRLTLAEAARKVGITGPTLKARMKNFPDKPDLWWKTEKLTHNEAPHNSKMIEYNGESISVSEASRRSGIKLSCLHARVKRYPDKPEVWFTPVN